MSRPFLIVIQGAPGAGKSTLLKKLKADIALPMLGKDDIKEMLFDTIPQSDREFSRLQGVASFGMLYCFAETFLAQGRDVLIEGAFHHDIARPNIEQLLKRTNARFLEIYCHVDEETRVQRVNERTLNGSRHPAHQDHVTLHLGGVEAYGKLEIGTVIDVDMTNDLDDKAYSRIKESIIQERQGN